jgi:hypothetical protein
MKLAAVNTYIQRSITPARDAPVSLSVGNDVLPAASSAIVMRDVPTKAPLAC